MNLQFAKTLHVATLVTTMVMGLQHEEDVREEKARKAILPTNVRQFLSVILCQRNELLLDSLRLFGGRGGLCKISFTSSTSDAGIRLSMVPSLSSAGKAKWMEIKKRHPLIHLRYNVTTEEVGDVDLTKAATPSFATLIMLGGNVVVRSRFSFATMISSIFATITLYSNEG